MQEHRYGLVQAFGVLGHRASRALYFVRCFGGLCGGCGYCCDVTHNALRAAGRLRYIMADFICGRALFFNGSGNRGHVLIYFTYCFGDLIDGRHRTLRRCLDLADLSRDIAGSFGRLFSKAFHL